MRRRRSALESLIELKRNGLDQLELELTRLRNRQASSKQRARSLAADLAARRQSLAESTRLTGAELREHDEWAGRLHNDTRAALEVAKRLEAQAQDLLAQVVEARRGVEAIEKVHASRESAQRRAAERRAELELDELSLGRWAARQRY